MIRNMIRRLNEPFPCKRSLKASVQGQLYVALFIAAFLFIFKPFGMGYVPNPFAVALAFGAVSLLFSLSFDLLSRFVFKVETDVPGWTLWKWLLQSILMVSWIAFGNNLLQLLLFGGDVGNIRQWAQVWQATITLGSIPIFVSGLFVQMRAIKSNVQQASVIKLPVRQAAQDAVVEFSLNSNEPLHVAVKDLLLVEAMQNYVMMYVREEGSVSKHMVRNTIVNTLAQFQKKDANNIIRCHRSYLVNIDEIGKVEGNAQGLKLTLNQLSDRLVPVSRSFIAEFKSTLERAIGPSKA